MIRFAWWLVSSLLYNLISVLVLQTLGYFLIPVAILFRREETSYVTGQPIVNAPLWLWLYGNDEDGLDPPWYREANPTWGAWRRMWAWAAYRNPVNNLRFIEWLHPRPKVGQVIERKYGTWTMLYQGWACNMLIPVGKGWLYIGWKYWPYDLTATVQNEGDWRFYGCGFGTHWDRSGNKPWGMQ